MNAPSTSNERLVMLSPAAQTQVRSLLDKEKDGTGLRLGIKGGGCSGLSYVIEFTEEKKDDTVVEYPDFSVFLDPKSTLYLKGILLDFQDGLTGKGFVFSNPLASNTCGCGESFSL